MANGDLIKLGTLYVNGVKQLRPTRPWRVDNINDFTGNGDIPQNSNNGIIEIRNSELDETYKIYWREVNIDSKKLLIADRNLLVHISWDNLNSQGLIFGKTITIDGQQYKLRVLTGGNYFRIRGIDPYTGGSIGNEWDRIIANEDRFPGLPTPSENDLLGPDSADRNGAHNKFWNWFGCFSWAQEELTLYSKNYACRGYKSPRYYDFYEGKYGYFNYGWRPVLEVLNEPPTITDFDKNLGDKNTEFSIAYQVNDSNNDSLLITEKLNGTILRTLNNAPKNENLTINISREQLYVLPLNVENKISIEVNDGKGGVSYRNYTFRRTNTAPIISNTDKNLGIITDLTEKYTINDMEGNAVTIVEKLDNVVLRSFAAGLGKEYTTTIDKDTWIKLKNGQHTYSIEATDSNNSKSTRVFSFTKKETKIDFTLAKPFSTDIKASKILVTPSWELNGATAKVEVCNNAFDASPTWEDITKQVLINRHYNFTNATKTADKWGINIRIYIEKDAVSLAEVSIKGFGGAFE